MAITQEQIDNFITKARAAGFSQSKIDAEIKRKLTQEIAAQGIPIGEIQTDPNLLMAQAQQLAAGTYKTEGDADSGIENRLTVLEGLWFPNEDKLALPKATNVIGRTAHKASKRYEASTEYELFRRYAKTLGASLAKAAGDTGNIAWAEQAAQLQALADADLTKEEALQSFKNIREGLGLEVKDDKYYNQLRQGKAPEGMETLSPLAVPPDITQDVVPASFMQQPTSQATQQAVDMVQQPSAAQQFKTGFASAPYRNVDEPYAESVRNVSGKIQGVAPLALALLGRTAFGKPGSVAGAGAGELLGLMTGEGIENVAGVQDETPKELLARTAKQPLKTAGTTAAIEAALSLLRPSQLAKSALNVRQSLAQKAAQKGVTGSGERIAETAVNQKVASGLGKASQQARLEAIENYGGKRLTVPEILEYMTREGRQAFGKGGDIKTKAAGEVSAALNRALREELKQTDPLTYLAHQLLVRPTQAITSGVGRYIYPGAIGAGVAGGTTYALNKLLGRE